MVKVAAGGEGGEGGGGGGGASSEAVVAAAEAAAKAQKKADALEIIAKNFAMRLDTLADQCRSTAQVAEHAKEAATAAGLMGGAWGASSRPSYAADGGHGRGVRFADDGPGSPPPMPADPGHAMQDIMRYVRSCPRAGDGHAGTRTHVQVWVAGERQCVCVACEMCLNCAWGMSTALECNLEAFCESGC